VAVPLFHEHDVVAALGFVVPTLKRNRARLVAALQVAAQGISREISAPDLRGGPR
jgi:DNA-binding IclR family transcriptional regulator